ncbi:MAG: MFS transporter [Acidobacteria bacterium]|nr:MFS transporter [Acidobacteriota bacterium]
MKRFYPWLLVALLWVVALLNYLDRQVIFSVFPLVKADLAVSDIQLGLLGTAFLWVYGILSPFGGYLADRFGRRNIILASLGVWSAITLLTGYARSYPELLTARALMGISEACYLPAALAMIADYHGERTRSLATGLHQSGLYMGIVLGGAGGGWMGQQFGWRAAFVVLGGFGVAYAAVLIPLLRRSTTAGQAQRPSVGRLAAMPFAIFTTANTFTSIAYWCVYTWLPYYLYERFRMSLAEAGFAATFYIQAASFAGILAGGTLADRWSRSNPRARVLTQAIGLTIAGPFLLLVGYTDSSWILIAALILFGLGRGLFDCNVMPVVCQVVEPELRATAYGVLNCTSCLGGGAMAMAAGLLKSAIGLGGTLQISGVILAAAAATLVVSRRKLVHP